MKVRWKEKDFFPYMTKDKIYDVISIEKDWYRLIGDWGEDYLHAPECFDIVDDTDEEELRAEDLRRWPDCKRLPRPAK